MSDGASALPCSTASPSRTLDALKWIFSFPAVLGAGLVALVFAPVRAFQVDPDMWWHIKTGETILATHRWPTHDAYSFTASGQPWIDSEWLGETLIAAVSRIGGLRGLELFLVVLGGLVLLSLCLLATIGAGNSKAGFMAAVLVSPFALVTFNLRPQMLGFLFLVFTLIVLELFRQGKQWTLWMLPLLFLIWVNSHGSWAVGLGTVFVYWFCGLRKFRLGGIEAGQWTAEEHRRISLVVLLSLVAVTITPYGIGLAAFPLRMAASLPLTVGNISEWAPIFVNMGLAKIFLVLIFGFFILQIILGMTWRLQELVLFFGSAVLTFLHARFVLVFAPFFALFLGRVLARWLRPYARGKDRFALNGILMAGLLAAMVHYFPTRAELEQKVADRFPVKAVAYLRQHPTPGPMFNSDSFGGYLIWSLGPEQKVFIDGRYEFYEHERVLAEYLKSARLQPGGLGVLERYHIHSCLLHSDEPLATVLSVLPDWQVIYSDHTSTLFVRRNPLTESAPQRAEPAAERRE